MNSEKFWLIFWAIIIAGVLGTISSVGGCVSKGKEIEASVITNAIQRGIDPITAKCAMMIGGNTPLGSAETAICLNSIESHQQ